MPDRKKNSHSDEREKEMPLSGHLREMRNRILVCLVLLLAAILAGIRYAPQMVALLLSIGRAYGYRFIYISPQELLMQYFLVAFVAGICVIFPVFCYQVWAFVRPGLKKAENLLFLFAMIFGFICFCIGVSFAYWIMLPFMLEFLISISMGSQVAASVSVQNYISFLMTVFLVFGIVFELPMISVLLTQMGLLKVSWMKKGRKVAVVAVFFIAAVITPPDVVSQIMVAVPMLVLYEVSIVLCIWIQKIRTGIRNKKKE